MLKNRFIAPVLFSSAVTSLLTLRHFHPKEIMTYLPPLSNAMQAPNTPPHSSRTPFLSFFTSTLFSNLSQRSTAQSYQALTTRLFLENKLFAPLPLLCILFSFYLHYVPHSSPFPARTTAPFQSPDYTSSAIAHTAKNNSIFNFFPSLYPYSSIFASQV